jgi:hypothetical protein
LPVGSGEPMPTAAPAVVNESEQPGTPLPAAAQAAQDAMNEQCPDSSDSSSSDDDNAEAAGDTGGVLRERENEDIEDQQKRARIGVITSHVSKSTADNMYVSEEYVDYDFIADQKFTDEEFEYLRTSFPGGSYNIVPKSDAA